MSKQREEFLIKHKDCIDFLKTLGLNKIEFDGNNQIIGITRQSHCNLTFREIELMMRTWQQAQKVAVPEGFVVVPVESLKVALFWMDENIDPWQMGGDTFKDLFEHKPVLEKAMVEAQEKLT